ncbi:MAG: hypothetical protein WC314_08830 [Vulcanimicrobiota bacterium]
MLEVLLERGSVTVLTQTGYDLLGLDRVFGTKLASKSFEIIRVDSWLTNLMASKGVSHHVLGFRLFLAAARAERRKHGFCVSAYNDLDLGAGSACLEYMHSPPCNHSGLLRQQNLGGRRWVGKLLALANIAVCEALVPWNDARVSRNWIVTNSSWTSSKFSQLYGKPADRVIFPPPTLNHCAGNNTSIRPADHAASERLRTKSHGFIAIGRAHEEKGWLDTISIVRALRELGHHVFLTMFILPCNQGLHAMLEHQAEMNSSWLQLHVNAPREQIEEAIATHKFGLHAATAESYGMAVAELLQGGCLTAVRDLGGQVEIVTEPELRFVDIEDAVTKLDRVLGSPSLQQRLYSSQQARRDRYNREAFLSSFRSCLDEFRVHARITMAGNEGQSTGISRRPSRSCVS